MEFRKKIMLHCSREVKCQQGCIPEIYYSMQNLVGSNHLSWVVGLVIVSTTGFHRGGPISFSGRARCMSTFC